MEYALLADGKETCVHLFFRLSSNYACDITLQNYFNFYYMQEYENIWARPRARLARQCQRTKLRSKTSWILIFCFVAGSWDTVSWFLALSRDPGDPGFWLNDFNVRSCRSWILKFHFVVGSCGSRIFFGFGTCLHYQYLQNVAGFWIIPCQVGHSRTRPSPILMKIGTSIVSHEKSVCAKFKPRMTSGVRIRGHQWSRFFTCITIFNCL